MTTEGKKTPISSAIVDLVANGMVQTVQGVTGSTFFGPGQPLAPVGPPDLPLRTFDYPYSQNLNTRPRQQEGIDFADLRALADAHDITRLVIETRKDQVVGLPQAFRLRKKPGEGKDAHIKREVDDPRVKALNDMFRYPDGERDFKTWIRAFLEEVFVTDALTLAPRYMMDGSISALDVIDGATIVRKIDGNGRTPLPPSVAYQQILKGMPAKDLTTRDIIYKPRNYRVNRIYGMSPVEQIIITVNMALRRQQTQLAYFTEGNIPEAIADVPDTWTADDITRMQDMFDNLKGDIAKKSRIRFVPSLDKIIFSKEKMLADEFDVWLARIVCFCFSISPQPFVKIMNKATAKTANDQALTEGLIPILVFISSTFNLFVEKYLLLDDIEHAFLDDEESDRLIQAQIDKIYVGMGKNSIDEVRVRDGEEPIGMGNAVITPAGPIPLKPFLEGGPLEDGLPQHTNPPDPNDPEGGPPGTKQITDGKDKNKEAQDKVDKLRKAKTKKKY